MSNTTKLLNKLMEFLSTAETLKRDVLLTPDEILLFSWVCEVTEGNYHDTQHTLRCLYGYPRKYLILKSIYDKITK